MFRRSSSTDCFPDPTHALTCTSPAMDAISTTVLAYPLELVMTVDALSLARSLENLEIDAAAGERSSIGEHTCGEGHVHRCALHDGGRLRNQSNVECRLPAHQRSLHLPEDSNTKPEPTAR